MDKILRMAYKIKFVSSVPPVRFVTSKRVEEKVETIQKEDEVIDLEELIYFKKYADGFDVSKQKRQNLDEYGFVDLKDLEKPSNHP